MNDNSKPIDVNAEANELKARMGVATTQTPVDPGAQTQVQSQQKLADDPAPDFMGALGLGMSADELQAVKSLLRVVLSEEIQSVQDLKNALHIHRADMEIIKNTQNAILSEMRAEMQDIRDRVGLLLDMSRNPDTDNASSGDAADSGIEG